MKLEQTDYITTREFELGPVALKCKEKGVFSLIETDVPYEAFGVNQFSRRSKIPSFAPWITGLLMLFFTGYIRSSMDWSTESGTLLLIMAGSGFLAWRFAMLFKRMEILIPTDRGQLIFWEDSPDKESVLSFIDELNSKVKEFYLKKYGTFDKDLPIEPQLTKYLYLKDRGIVTTEEFEELKNQALGKNKNSANTIGFK